MRRWRGIIIGMLVLLGVTVLPALAESKKERWEYKERKEYTTPKISASEAKRAVEASRPRWRVGAVHQKQKKEGIEVRVLIRNEEGTITKMGIDPMTGEILPRSIETHGREVLLSKEEITKKVEAILPNIVVGDRAWLGKRGRYWRIPLFWDGMLVSTVKVDTLTGKLLTAQPDKDEEDDD